MSAAEATVAVAIADFTAVGSSADGYASGSIAAPSSVLAVSHQLSAIQPKQNLPQKRVDRMPNLRTIGRIAVLLSVMALVAFVIGATSITGGHFQSRSFTYALYQYKQDPSPENERVFREKQQQYFRERDRVGLAVGVVSFLLLGTAALICKWIWRVRAKATVGSLALMLLCGLTGSAFTATTVDAWVNGVHVYGETTNMLPGMLVGMPVGLAVAMVVFRKRGQA